MKNILGQNLQLFVGESGKEKALGCATDLSLTLEANTIDISCKDSGNFGSNMAGKLSWSISTSALVVLDDDGKLVSGATASKSYTDLMDLEMSRTPVHVIFSTIGNEALDTADSMGHIVPASGWTAGDDGYEGEAYITSVEITANDSDVASYTVQLSGAGALTKHSATKSTTTTGSTGN